MELMEFTEPLLGADEEVAVAKAIEAGLLAQEALHGAAREEDRDDLAELVYLGRAAHDRLVGANLRLVASVVRTWPRPPGGWDDLFQEGVLGLLEAIRRFDHRRGFRFATLALPWIRMRIAEVAITQHGRIGLPVGRAKLWRQAHALRTDLEAARGRAVSASEVAHWWGRPTAWVAELLAWRPPTALPPEAVALPTTETGTEHNELTVWLRRLGAEHRDIVVLRYGLTGSALTVAQTAGRLGLSESTVRRREREALELMRAEAGEPLVAA